MQIQIKLDDGREWSCYYGPGLNSNPWNACVGSIACNLDCHPDDLDLVEADGEEIIYLNDKKVGEIK